MNDRKYSTIAYFCFFIVIILLVFILISMQGCKPTSMIPAKLILHGPLYGTARSDGTLYVFGDVTNVGSGVAYNGRLFVIVNEGEHEYECFLSEFRPEEYRPLGDFKPGERKPFECDLVDYCWDDETRCTFRLSWDQERMLVCVSMDSDRLSGSD